MRAILLAAGIGTRLRPLTLETPKSLIIVNGKPLLERQIEFLRERGIEEIIIVTGYLNEKFQYLVDKYGATLIYNENYAIYNNIYSMYLVRDYLENSYVIDADNYLNRNFIIENPKESMYFSAYKEDVENEYRIIFDENNKVRQIDVMDGVGSDYILSGVSYWKDKDAKIIIKEIDNIISNEEKFKKLYWDDIVRLNIDKIDVYIEKIKEDDIFEIDSINDLEKVNEILGLKNK